MAVKPCNLDGSLVGLKTRIAEEDVFHARYPGEKVGNLDLQWDLEQIGAVNDLLNLIAERCDQSRMRMPEGVDRNAR